MRYIEQLLSADEEIVAIARKHPVLFVVPAIFAVIAILGYVWTQPIVFTLFFALAVLSLLYAAITYATSAIGLTNRRVLARSGLVARKAVEIPHDRLEAVEVEQSALGRALGFGTLEVRPPENGTRRFHRIAGVRRFRDRILEETGLSSSAAS